MRLIGAARSAFIGRGAILDERGALPPIQLRVPACVARPVPTREESHSGKRPRRLANDKNPRLINNANCAGINIPAYTDSPVHTHDDTNRHDLGGVP
jgi:hypothetical protein